VDHLLSEVQSPRLIDIPAHTRHRVEATRSDGPTVWLAIHY
jgi:hypothetical protein